MDYSELEVDVLEKILKYEKRKKKPDLKAVNECIRCLMQKREDYYKKLQDFKSVDAIKTDVILKSIIKINRILA